MTRIPYLVVALALATLGSTAPAFAQNPPAAPTSTDAAPPPLVFPGGILWQTTLPASPASGVAFDDEHAYVAMRNGSLAAVSLDAGAVVWIAPRSTSGPLAAADGLVVGSDERVLWALDAKSGTLRWEHPIEQPSPVGPVAGRSVVVFVTAAGTVEALHAADGSTAWRTDAGSAPSTSPIVDRDRVLAAFADGRVLCLSIQAGTRIWERRLRSAVLSLAASERRVFAGSSDNFLYALSSRNGGVDWRWRTGGDVPFGAVTDGALVYSVSMDNVVRASKYGGGSLVWQRPLPSRPAAAPLLIEQRIVAVSIAPDIRTFDPEDGHLSGVYALPGRVEHTPRFVPADGDAPSHLVVVTTTGHVLAIGGSLEPPARPPTSLPGRPVPPRLLVVASRLVIVDGAVEANAAGMDAPPGTPQPSERAGAPEVPTPPTLVRLNAVPGRPSPPRLLGWPVLVLDGSVEVWAGPLVSPPGVAVPPEMAPEIVQ